MMRGVHVEGGMKAEVRRGHAAHLGGAPVGDTRLISLSVGESSEL